MAIGCCMRGCGGGAEGNSDRVFRDHSHYSTGANDSLAIDVILSNRHYSAFAEAAGLGLIPKVLPDPRVDLTSPNGHS
jgi:hypothetical protein